MAKEVDDLNAAISDLKAAADEAIAKSQADKAALAEAARAIAAISASVRAEVAATAPTA